MALSVTLVLATLLSACGGDDASSAADVTTTVASPATTPTTAAPSTTLPAPPADRGTMPGPAGIPAGKGSGAADAVFPRTVVHFGGATVVPAAPTRVAIIATGQLDGALTLGVVPVAVAKGEGAGLVPDYLAKAFADKATALGAMKDIGLRTAPNLEAIAAARPDLILANAAASLEIYGKLSAIAPTILTQGTGVNWKQDFLLMADALGRAGQARSFIDSYEHDAAVLGAATLAKRPAVSLVRFNAGRTRMFGRASFAGFVAWDAWLARPESQRFDETSVDVSQEQIAKLDGDWMFYSVQGEAAKTPATAFLGSPLWAALGAVKAQHVVLVDDDPWYLNAGPTAARVVLDGFRAALA